MHKRKDHLKCVIWSCTERFYCYSTSNFNDAETETSFWVAVTLYSTMKLIALLVLVCFCLQTSSGSGHLVLYDETHCSAGVGLLLFTDKFGQRSPCTLWWNSLLRWCWSAFVYRQVRAAVTLYSMMKLIAPLVLVCFCLQTSSGSGHLVLYDETHCSAGVGLLLFTDKFGQRSPCTLW